MNIPVNHRWGGPTTKQALGAANRHGWWRRIDWRINRQRLLFLWLGFVIATLILETTR